MDVECLALTFVHRGRIHAEETQAAFRERGDCGAGECRPRVGESPRGDGPPRAQQETRATDECWIISRECQLTDRAADVEDERLTEEGVERQRLARRRAVTHMQWRVGV